MVELVYKLPAKILTKMLYEIKIISSFKILFRSYCLILILLRSYSDCIKTLLRSIKILFRSYYDLIQILVRFCEGL